MAAISALLEPYDSVLPCKHISFTTYDGTILRGNFYHAPDVQQPAPTVIFIHGLGLLKEQYLENWFKHCLQAKYHVLTYDHRSFGDSDGMPRNSFLWTQQAEDLIDAVTYTRSLPEVLTEKVFAWGVAHAGGAVAMAAALDKRIAGIILFLPCIDGAWDKSQWSSASVTTSSGCSSPLEVAVERNRLLSPDVAARNETLRFWPLSDSEAAGTGGSVLSGAYVRDWSAVAAQMAHQSGKPSFTGRVTLMSICNDFSTKPTAWFGQIAPTPVLWIMASEDVVCGPSDFTMSEYEKLQGPKEVCVLEGEHLAQYFDPGFPRSVDAMLAFLDKHTA